jgi:hypothetical protein
MARINERRKNMENLADRIHLSTTIVKLGLFWYSWPSPPLYGSVVSKMPNAVS